MLRFYLRKPPLIKCGSEENALLLKIEQQVIYRITAHKVQTKKTQSYPI